VSVSTVPLADIGAIINYGTIVHCAPTSSLTEIGGYIKPVVTGTPETIQDLGAELNVLRIKLDLTSEIIGRKRTRLRILSLTFRSKTRASTPVRGSITPVIPEATDLSAEIVGLLHEADLPASITPVRFDLPDVNFTAVEKVADLETGEVQDILVSFRSQVNFYVYEEITNAVYSTDRGTWAIDLRTLLREESFFDRSLDNREFILTEVQEFYSLDEAIRNALVALCERRQENIAAFLSARGSISDFGCSIGIIGAGRMSNLATSIVPTGNSPDIAASISTSSALAAVRASITAENEQVVENIRGNITGNIVNDLGAEITAS
jgi:hypothetical protein